jgi:WD40 repeat protein
VTISKDTACIWNTLTGALNHGGEIDSVALSPDGAVLVAASSVDSVTLWDLPNPDRPVPRWFIELAEALGGRRLSAEGRIEEVSSDEFLAIKKQVLAMTTDDGFHALALWLLGDRHQDAPSTGPPGESGPVDPGR